MATNLTFKNTSQLNTVKVTEHDNHPVMVRGKDGNHEKLDENKRPVKEWRKGASHFVQPGESLAIWLQAGQRKVTFEEMPT